MAIRLTDPVQTLPGIGPTRAKGLEKLGIATAEDLLWYFPKRYEDRRATFSIADAPVETAVCVPALVAQRPVTSYIRQGLTVTKVRVVDDQGQMTLTFFNQTYVQSALTPGEEYIFFGKVEKDNGRVAMTNPVFEQKGRQRFTGRIMPVYPLTAGVSNNLIAGAVQRVLADCGRAVPERLPEGLRQAHGLLPIGPALQYVHFPRTEGELEGARRRLVFEELYYFSLGLALMKTRRGMGQGAVCAGGQLEDYIATLPFPLTNAQRRALEEAAADMASGRAMNRLIQGDVGSGKTVVAAGCLYLAAKSGWQSALMAPTEILARQHYATLEPLLARSGLQVRLLTGSMKAKEKRSVYEELELGLLDVVIGTHALLSEGVRFRRLGLVVTDEQHRFGVGQRAALAGKGGEGDFHPHVLVLSATPIPRTLALILYGDLEVSVMDELPPGRQSIDTFLISEDKRQRMYGFVRRQKVEGHQTYIVCPAVGDAAAPLQETELTPAQELKAVEAYAETLQKEVFPDLRIGLVHGKLSAKAKAAAMNAFASGETDVLVATTVIEVGVDVPNATLMVVENAERFGLSQLHQLRGRVGRGKEKSYCVLVSSNRSEETRKRLKALCSTNDGFKIAELDLELRGPGDFFGNRQHGLPQLRVADLAGDMRVLREAQEAAEALLAHDPDLQNPENRAILERVQELFAQNQDTLN